MSKAQHTPGPWEVRLAITLESGEYYMVSRIEKRRRVHLEYASNGKPMLYDRQSADEAIAKATGSTA